jgi:ABC-type polysaccharide/polyol phosphate transport system ATPase subunit
MAILKPCEIDFNNPPVKSEIIVSINDVPLGTQGNLFGITGSEGTGKSNYTGSLIAGTIRDTSFSIDTLEDSGFAQYCKQDRAALRYGAVRNVTL